MNCAMQDDMKTVQELTHIAYQTTSRFLALMDGRETNSGSVAELLDAIAGKVERGAVMIRNICEKHRPAVIRGTSKPPLTHMHVAGKAEVNEYGWLHIELNALLPHCRFQTPLWLTDTVTRLLDEYEGKGRPLPVFQNAVLIIDEHCDIKSRTVYDQDNKGYKAIPNALKGRVIKDDDQFTLGLALISTRSAATACHIYVVPQYEAGDFFALRQGHYPMFP